MSDFVPGQKWKSTMTDRERFNNQMHYRPIDRSFNMEFGYWEDNYKVWPLFTENAITNEGEANRFFGFDRFRVFFMNTWMIPGFPNKQIGETETNFIMMNSDGLIAEVPKDGHETIPHYIKASIVTPDDWKRCKEEHMRRDDPARKLDIEALKAKYPNDRDYPLTVDCGSMIGRVRNILTFEGLAYACYDYPDMVEDMIETCCVLVEDMLDQVLPHIRFDLASGGEDICFKNGPMVTLDFFREVIVPRYKRINKKLKDYGIDIWYLDCDGDIRPIIPCWLDAGVNCLFPFEVNACGHPVELAGQYGRELRLMGGVDKMKLIEGKGAIKEYLESLLPLYERGGYIPFCDHRCPPDVKPENYLYYLELKQKLFGM